MPPGMSKDAISAASSVEASPHETRYSLWEKSSQESRDMLAIIMMEQASKRLLSNSCASVEVG